MVSLHTIYRHILSIYGHCKGVCVCVCVGCGLGLLRHVCETLRAGLLEDTACVCVVSRVD